ncbi:hypothetical protein D1610_02110 [Sphingomonas gilva]|uniref:Flagellar biosynthesis protein FliO n=1 Tax=Sphingomonas gilva TaxID=2305907 RepID=A0A396RWV5_9SPHN|nr:hypothetical protein [Sphingomonas gilva]RHW18953.1 hypothetical protein D1610_02110 [Sphingomonas gilva]
MAGLNGRSRQWRVAATVWLLCHATHVHAAPGRLGGGGGVDIPIGRIFAVTMLCIMLAALAAFAIKRGGGRVRVGALSNLLRRLPADRRMQVIETRRASQFADVCLIRCDDREYLALCSQHQFLLLRESAAAEDAPECE